MSRRKLSHRKPSNPAIERAVSSTPIPQSSVVSLGYTQAQATHIKAILQEM